MSSNPKSLNFIEQIIEKDLKNKKHHSIQTRFPPEPNGFLHIGHAKSIFLNFGLAKKYNGKCNLRFDDTNPEKEESIYVESIKKDIKWLGFDWEDREYYASDYFDTLYEYAIKLIKKGKAYICDLSKEEFEEIKGTPTLPGKPSPYRERNVEENLTLFEEMKNGKYHAGKKVLRAKIDMSNPNMHLRDPILYRIKNQHHHRTGTKWCIYPSYDFAHGQCDSLEKVTHSLCTLEFEVHRPLYNWCINELEIYVSEQIEFARLNLSYTILSKRYLKELVDLKYVVGWDDPRMPTLSGIKRRGYPPEAIKSFIETIGIARRNGITDISLLEFSVREVLNKKCFRVMAVLNPIKLIITNWEKGKIEYLKVANNPENENDGEREVPFCGELYIDISDFMEDPPSPKKWYRLGPNREVRLKYAYIIQCTGFKKNENGIIEEIYATYDAETKSGLGNEKKVKGTIGWVSAQHSIKNSEVRIYDRLFVTENLNDIEDDFKNHLNPQSLIINNETKIEPSIKNFSIGDVVQFERIGYFRIDEDSTKEKLVFNKTISLKDNFQKIIQ